MSRLSAKMSRIKVTSMLIVQGWQLLFSSYAQKSEPIPPDMMGTFRHNCRIRS